MSEYILIGVDPGKTTGLFLYSNHARFGFLDRQYLHDEVNADDVAKRLRDFIVKATDYVGYGGVHIAVERFIINARTAKSSQQTDALEITGMVKGFAALRTPNPVRQYMKANLKFAADPALRRAGWYSPQLRHANDAARQAFALLEEINHPEWQRVAEGSMMKIDDMKKG